LLRAVQLVWSPSDNVPNPAFAGGVETVRWIPSWKPRPGKGYG